MGDILNDEDQEMEEEVYEEPQGAVGYTGPLPDYIDDGIEPMEDTQLYSDEVVDKKEFSGDVEDDPEMAEMLKMLEEAKGDLDGAHEEDLAELMESFEGEEEEETVAKPGLKRKSDNQEPDQVVPQSQDEEAKKQKVIGSVLRPMPGFLSGIAIQPDAEEIPISFDEEAKVDTISTPTKDRAPPPKNRRPPSRSSRKQPSCDNNEEHPQQNGSDSTNMPAPSPTSELKKKKKLKKKAPAGGVAMFGGVDLFGGKNPFAGRKQDISSSEDETSIEQQKNRSNDNGNKAELRLPFGAADANSQPSCDNVKQKGQSSRKTKAEVAEMKAKEEALERKKKEEEALEQKRKKEEAQRKKQEEQERVLEEGRKRKEEALKKQAERKRLEEERKQKEEAERKEEMLKKEEEKKKKLEEEKRKKLEEEKRMKLEEEEKKKKIE